MDAAPDTWLTSPMAFGANGGQPPVPVAFITVMNLASASLPITVSLVYVPLVA
jgi:hypothetical protein